MSLPLFVFNISVIAACHEHYARSGCGEHEILIVPTAMQMLPSIHPDCKSGLIGGRRNFYTQVKMYDAGFTILFYPVRHLALNELVKERVLKIKNSCL